MAGPPLKERGIPARKLLIHLRLLKLNSGGERRKKKSRGTRIQGEETALVLQNSPFSG